jgi:hypothetical protein
MKTGGIIVTSFLFSTILVGTLAYFVGIVSSMSTRVKYEISVAITGVGNNTQYFIWYRVYTETSSNEISGNYYIRYISEPLTQGEYEIKAFCHSVNDATGANYFILTNPIVNYTRTIIGLEIL